VPIRSVDDPSLLSKERLVIAWRKVQRPFRTTVVPSGAPRLFAVGTSPCRRAVEAAINYFFLTARKMLILRDLEGNTPRVLPCLVPQAEPQAPACEGGRLDWIVKERRCKLPESKRTRLGESFSCFRSQCAGDRKWMQGKSAGVGVRR
jgi:hypothetical protein